MKKLLIILTIILLPSFAFATFSIQFDNTTDKKVYYALFWIDHTYDWPHPFNLAGGELDAKETIDLEEHYKSGQYFVIWSDAKHWQNKVMINADAGVTSVKVTPEASKMHK